MQSRNPEGYFGHSNSSPYFQSQILPGFCFKIQNPELQIREIPDPVNLIGDPLVICLTLKLTVRSFITHYKINNCKRHQKQAKLILNFCFTLSLYNCLLGVIKGYGLCTGYVRCFNINYDTETCL